MWLCGLVLFFWFVTSLNSVIETWYNWIIAGMNVDFFVFAFWTRFRALEMDGSSWLLKKEIYLRNEPTSWKSKALMYVLAIDSFFKTVAIAMLWLPILIDESTSIYFCKRVRWHLCSQKVKKKSLTYSIMWKPSKELVLRHVGASSGTTSRSVLRKKVTSILILVQGNLISYHCQKKRE